jgi:hypothetical protein
MGDLKPLGSEKLNADEKLKRILALTYYNDKNNKPSNNGPKAELVKESKSGGVYGIVKEKDGYYVKMGLNESSLDYIGGLYMKNKNKFSSYAEALKRLELLKGQDLQEATKYVLKQAKPQQEVSAPTPSLDVPPPPPSSDATSDAMPPSDDASAMPSPETSEPSGDTSTPETSDTNGDEGKRSSYMSEVQKYAGKLGQELRDQREKMESDDIKYVLNMIISACDLNKLSDEDIEEIGKKFDRDEETPSEEPSAEEPSAEETPTPEVPAEKDLGEEDSMSSLEEFINSSAPSDQEEINLSKYADLDGDGQKNEEEIKELDLDEIKDSINKAIGETLHKYFK